MAMKALIIIIAAIGVSTFGILMEIKSNTITRTQFNDMKEQLIISRAIVNKCAQNDTIDIMQYVRDAKREIDVQIEFNPY